MSEQVPISQRNLEGFLGIANLDKQQELLPGRTKFGILDCLYTDVYKSKIQFAGSSLGLDDFDKIFEVHMTTFFDSNLQRFLSLNPFEKLYLARKSLQAAAQYIDDYNLEPQYIAGVTHGTLASTARLLGFKQLDVNVPPEYSSRIKYSYVSFSEKEFKNNPSIRSQRILEPPALAYLSKDDFMGKFWKPRQATELDFTP